MSVLMRSLLICLSIIFVGQIDAGEKGIVMSATSPWTDAYGYTPIIVTIQSPEDTTITMQTSGNSSTASMAVALRAGIPVRQTILIPPANGNYLYVSQIDWFTDHEAMGHVSISRSHSDKRGFLIDPDEKFDLVGLNKKITSKRSSSDGFIRLNPEQLPDRWQGFPSWIVIILTPKGQADLTDEQRNALATWVRSGGSLCVTSEEQTQQWQRLNINAPFIDVNSKKYLTLQKLFNRHNNYESWEPEDVPVPGTETVPVKTFVFLAIIFALIVGPLNLWWVRRRNARHLFIFTTPALSLATCVILIVASLLADGVSTKRSAVQLIFIDHTTQQSVRWTGCSYFAAFSSTAIDLDHSAQFTVLDHQTYDRHRSRGYNAGPRPTHIAWGQSQNVSGSIIPARVHRQLGYIEALPERRRVEIRPHDDGYQLTNGLGVDLISFRWLDKDGIPWSCNTVQSGQQQLLKSEISGNSANSTTKPSIQVPPLPTDLKNRLSRSATLAWENLSEKPFSFIASVDRPLDAIPGPASIDVIDPKVFVTGLVPPIGGTP